MSMAWNSRIRGHFGAACLWIALLLTWEPRSALAQRPLPSLAMMVGRVNASLVAGDTLYLGGNFNYVGPVSGACGVFEKSSEVPLAGWPTVDGTVYCSAPDGEGGWYVGGQFLQVGPFARHNLAHIRSDFSVDTWNPGADLRVNAMVRAGATLYVAGSFTTIAGQARSRAAAFDLDSGLLTGWSPNLDNTVNALVVRDTVTYLGGAFSRVGGQVRGAIASVNTATGQVSAWNPGVVGTPATVLGLEESEGTVYVAGTFSQIGGQARANLAAVDSANGLVTAWNPGASGAVRGVRASGARIYAFGDFETIGGSARRKLAALDPVTGLATPWDPLLGANSVYALVAGGPTLYAAGDIYLQGGDGRANLVAIDSASAAAVAWSPGTLGKVYALESDGSRIFVGGALLSLGGDRRICLAAIDLRTGLLIDWHPVVYVGHINALAADATTLYVGGNFTYMDNIARNNIAAFDRATGTVKAWNPGTAGEVLALQLAGPQLYMGGYFGTVAGQPRARLAAVDATTGALSAWNPGADGPVLAIAASGSTVYATGQFTKVGGLTRNRIAAVDAVTGAVTGWDPNLTLSGYGTSLALDGPTVYVGGSFTVAGGQLRSSLAAIDSASGLATPWNPSTPGYVGSLLVHGNTMFAGGRFFSAGGEFRPHLAAIDLATGRVMDWQPSADSTVSALAAKDRTLFVGGVFNRLSNVPSIGFGGLPLPAFDVAVTPDGPGTVSRSPDLPSYPGGEVLTLTASPAPGRTFLGWTGDTTGTSNPLVLRVIRDRALAAQFADTTRPAVAVVAPAGGASVGEGDPLSIEWVATDGAGVASVDLLLSRHGLGGPFTTIAAAIPNRGSHTWTVGGPPTGDARIEVVARDAAGNAGTSVAAASFTIRGPGGAVPAMPPAFALSPPYPNPATDRAHLAFELPMTARVIITLYDLDGRRVARLADGERPPGRYVADVDASALRAGLYFVRMEAPGLNLSRRVAIVK